MEKTYNPQGLEEKWYAVWESEKLFRARGEGESYVITLPPPNVTGILHIGHCLGGSTMDALVRYYRMVGRPTLFIPGTDHASIATENKVAAHLAEQGIDKAELGREAFIERAWEWANSHHDRIVSQFKRFGMSLDWEREAFTMDEERSRAVLEAFVRLYEKGLVYRGNYMTNWSVAQQSAVSDEEVVHKEVNGKLWHFQYPLEDGGHLVVATTRPETMLGDTAVAIHPKNPKTAHLRGKRVRLPIVDRLIDIIEDDYVDPEFGTGCVKVTPAHDPNDYEMGKRHDLQFINIMNPDGTLNDNAPEDYRGLDRFVARKKVVAQFEQLGLLDSVKDHVHMVGYHDRTNTVIEPYISRQWFLKMEDLAKPALEAVENGVITIWPERWVGVYYNWMRNIRDWCISRQLWWGHRIPFYECTGCQASVVSVDAPGDCAKCGASSWIQDGDVFDTWFSSWLWTFSPLGWPQDTEDLRQFHPTSTLVTGADIIFFWVARMVMASYEFRNEPPFTEVLFTGLVRDAKGRKLSKSLNNSPDPMDLMDKYGADALRFTLTMVTPTGQDINFGEETVELGRNFCNKVWNATRLLFSNLEDLGLDLPKGDATKQCRDLGGGDESNPQEWFERLYRECFGAELPSVPREDLRLEDRWMLHATASACQKMASAMEARRLNDSVRAAYDCFWKDFCDWYLEASKERLHGDNDAGKTTALLVALTVHAIMLRLLHPFVPYITEELWSAHPASDGRCMVAPMPAFASAPFAQDAAKFNLVQDIVSATRNVRNEMGVPPGRRGSVILQADGDRREELESLVDRVAYLGKFESARVEPVGDKPDQAAATVVGDVELFLPFAGLIDLDKERKRLEKERQGVANRLAAIEAKLKNANFVERAPANVVERERASAVSLQETLAKLEGQMASLG